MCYCISIVCLYFSLQNSIPSPWILSKKLRLEILFKMVQFSFPNSLMVPSYDPNTVLVHPPLKVLIFALGSSQFQDIERGASDSQYFSLFLRRVGSPKVEFDDTSNVIWEVRKWQYHRRVVSKINNLSVALARIKVFRYSYVAWESIFSFLQPL